LLKSVGSGRVGSNLVRTLYRREGREGGGGSNDTTNRHRAVVIEDDGVDGVGRGARISGVGGRVVRGRGPVVLSSTRANTKIIYDFRLRD